MRTRALAFLFIIFSVLLLSACSGGGNTGATAEDKTVLGTSTSDSTSSTADSSSASSNSTGPIKVDIKEENNSGQSGTATLESTPDGKTKVHAVMNIKTEKAEPIHIFTGDCANPINIPYALNDVKDGVSETILDFPLDEIKKAEPLVMVVHPSTADWSGKYVACGELQ